LVPFEAYLRRSGRITINRELDAKILSTSELATTLSLTIFGTESVKFPAADLAPALPTERLISECRGQFFHQAAQVRRLGLRIRKFNLTLSCSLLGTQGSRGVDRRGFASRRKTCDCSHDNHHGGAGEAEQNVMTGVCNPMCDPLAKPDAERQSECDSRSDAHAYGAKHEVDEIALRCAERQANSEFIRALGN
jgi:hypothetical protein